MKFLICPSFNGAGIPVHTVTQGLGDDPATLPGNYAKRRQTKQADASLSAALARPAGGFLADGKMDLGPTGPMSRWIRARSRLSC